MVVGRAWLLLASFAIASRLLLLIAMPMAPLAEVAVTGDGDTRYYVHIAQHLASTGEYAQWNLRAYMPPGYPFFLSRLLLLGADSRVLQIAQNVLCLLAVLIVVVFAVRQGGRRVGVLVGVLALLSPNGLLLPQKAMSETLFLILLAVGLVLVFARITLLGIGRALFAGVIFGLAGLVREVAVPLAMVLALVVGVWVGRTYCLRRGVALGVALLIGTGLAIVPWTARNYTIFGEIVPIALNGPINLYIGNNPRATGIYEWRLPPAAQAVWNQPDEGWSKELFAARLAGREAVKYIRENPRNAVALMPRKIATLWGPPVALHPGHDLGALVRDGMALAWFAALSLGVAGLWMMRHQPLGWFIAGACIMATGLHAVTFGDVRFRAPLEYLLMLPAGLAAATLWERIRPHARP